MTSTKPRYSILQKISWYIGLIAMMGGWIIFLIWTLARYLFAIALDRLEWIGFLWTVVFFFLACLALILLIIYAIVNRRTLSYKMLWTALLILLNIPSVLYIVPKTGSIDRLVFIKLKNETGLGTVDITLKGGVEEIPIGKIREGNSKVFNYIPDYINKDARIYMQLDTLWLLVGQPTRNDSISFPNFYNGRCVHITINSELELIYEDAYSNSEESN